MRILAIRGRNLASLAGDFEVDLAADPIAGTGLFAITGETGAGKSTILDALALALYGEHPRAGGGREEKLPDPSGATDISAGDSRALLRRGTGSGFAEVDFVGRDGVTYRARWAVNRARGRAAGNLQKEERSLHRLPDGGGIASGIRPVLEAVERLTDLTFAQFRRTVLLAQGEFDAFLMAREEHRADLLERITGTGLYGDISRRVHELRAASQAEHDGLVARRDAIGLIEEQERERLGGERALTLRLAQAGTALLAARQAMSGAESRRAAALAALPALAEAAAQAAERLAVLEPQAREAEALVARLEPQWQEATRQDAAIRIGAEETQRLAGVAGEARKAEAAVERSLAEAGQKAEQATARQAELALRIDAGARLDGLAHRQAGVREGVGKRADLAGQSQAARKLVAASERAIAAAVTEIDARDKAIRDFEIALARLAERRAPLETERDAIDAPALAAEIRALDSRIAAAREAWRASEAAVRARAEATKARDAGIAAAGEAATRQQTRALAQGGLEKAEAGLAAMETAADLAEAAAGREAALLRSRLVAGESCPVCGAREHPHAHDGGELGALAARLRSERESLRRLIATSRSAVNEETRLIAAARGSEEAATRRLAEAEAALAEATEAFSASLHTLGASDLPAVPGPEARAALEALGQDLKARREAVMAVQDRLEILRSELDSLTADERAARDRLDGERSAAAAARARQAGAEADLARSTAALAGLDERLASIARELRDDLALLRLDIAAVDADPVAALGRLDRAIAERVALHQALDAAVRDVGEARIAAERAGVALDSARLARANAEAQVSAKSEDLERLRRDRAALFDGEATEPHSRRHRAAASEAGRLAEAARRALAEARGMASAAGDALKGLENDVAVAARALGGAEGAFGKALADRTHSDPDDAQTMPPDLGAFVAEAQQQAGAIAQRLAQDDLARTDAATLSAGIAEAAASLAVWNDVHAAIGSADGGRFRRFAQGITLDHLVALANEHLAALSPRYRLGRAEIGDLGLVVIDRDMADERRSTRSLSGGERFLVSLGLALALSGLEGRQAFVDTLFIDEGFGALDAETLDMAVDALEALQGRGRKVGVITHVAVMIERIAVKVLVEKRGGGRSEVRVVAG